MDQSVASTHIPAARRIFYGREKDLDRLIGIVTDNSAARIAILGTGGIGKYLFPSSIRPFPHKHILIIITDREVNTCNSLNARKGHY